MSIAGFDYSQVWTQTLMSGRVTVHEYNWSKPSVKVEPLRDGGEREAHRSRCGKADVFVNYRHPDGTARGGGFNYGAFMLAGHAIAMGAHFCRRCFPDGAA